MLRSFRMVLLVLLAMFVVAVPAGVAQTPVDDQYQADEPPPPDDFGNGPDEVSGNAPAEVSAPVRVRSAAPVRADRLPFTWAQVSLVALIGLGLLAAGVGLAVIRGRGSSAPS